MDINAFVLSCEHPKTITTRNGSKMVVSCGKCKSCLIAKGKSRVTAINEESKKYLYSMFFTLTYSPDHVPCCYPVFTKLPLFTGLRTKVELFDCDTDEYLGFTLCGENKVHQLIKKSDDGKLHYSRYSDVQKFLKRFRKHLNKITDEKIKYYICSEYGPVRFRPHYHGIFFFNSYEIFKNFGQLLSKSWTLGHFDFSLSRGLCASYVASYINSFISLPKIFQMASTMPKSSHSKSFGYPFISSSLIEIYKNEPEKFARIVKHEIHGTVSSSAPWRSYKAWFFPKCYNWTNKTPLCRAESYECLQRLLLRYNCSKVSDLCYYIMSDYEKGSLPDYYHRVLFDDDVFPPYDVLLSRLYSFKHLYNLQLLFNVTAHELYSIVDKFYTSLDMINLKEQYEIIENYQYIDRSEFDLFSNLFAYGIQYYDDDFNSLVPLNGNLYELSFIKNVFYTSNLYNRVVNENARKYNKSIKHKVQNDLNNVLL